MTGVVWSAAADNASALGIAACAILLGASLIAFDQGYFCGQRTCRFSTRHGQFVKDFLNDGFAGLVLRLGFVGDRNPVAQDVHADAFDILRGDVTAPAQEGIGFGGERQRNTVRARRCACWMKSFTSFYNFPAPRVAQTRSTM